MTSQMEKVCNVTIQHHIDCMHTLCDEHRIKDAESVYSEIRDWVVNKEDIKILSLERISDYFEDF